MRTRRTQKEIDGMIFKLKREKKTIPHYSLFRDNNWAAIDVQLDVLEGKISDEDEVYDLKENADIEERDDFGDNIVSAALDALMWIDGEDILLVEDIDDEPDITYPTYEVNKVAKKIKIKTEDWAGNCYGIASACLRHKVVEGKLCYGHWIGPISKFSKFAKNISIGFAHHGWIELKNGGIFDPTRWAFEMVEPYIYVGKNDHYDMGGNQYLAENRTPPPTFDINAELIELNFKSSACDIFVKELLKDHRTKTENKYTSTQIHWLVTLSLPELGPFASAIYDAAIKAKMGGFIPIDN